MSPLPREERDTNAPSSAAAAQLDRDLDLGKLERFAERLAALEGTRGARLECLADPQAEVIVERAPVAEHDPLAGVDAPLARRLDDLDGPAVANGAMTKPALAHRFEYRPIAPRTCERYVTRKVLTFWRETCSTCLRASSARAHVL